MVILVSRNKWFVFFLNFWLHIRSYLAWNWNYNFTFETFQRVPFLEFLILIMVVILKNHLRLLFIYKSQLLIFWLYTIMQSIINFLCLKMIKICNIISSYLEENQKPFLGQWLVDLYRKRKKNIIPIQQHVFFDTGQVTSTKRLKS